MSDIFSLFRLQQLDSQTEVAQTRMRKIEMALKNDSILRQADQGASESLAKLEATQKQGKKVEADVDAIKIKLSFNQSSLYSGKVRNPKELQDLQGEAQSLQRHLSILEDQQIECMIATEEAEKDYQIAKSKRDEIQAQMIQRSSQLRGEISTLQDSLSHIATERQAMLASISANFLEQYEQLRKKKNGVAVARIVNNACSACGATLNAALIHNAHVSSSLSYCDVCGRILYAG